MPPSRSGERGWVRLEHEDEVEGVGDEQHHGQAEVEERFLPDRVLGREEPAERARQAQADDGDQHHRAVHAGGAGVVVLVVEAHASQEERESEREQEVREDRPDERCTHHVEQPRLERDDGDDELGGVAERRVEQPADGIARARRELLRGADDHGRNRNDRERGREEHDRGRGLRRARARAPRARTRGAS